jgi:mannose-6-phosphate isomerase-like protein (cupin superfamily)
LRATEEEVAAVIELSDLMVSPTAARFEGKDHGVPVSFFATTHPRGEGPELHRHRYQEIFVLHEGAGVFTIEDETVQAHAGHVVIVPAGAAHRFKCVSEVPLRQVSIHPAPAIEQEWL